MASLCSKCKDPFDGRSFSCCWLEYCSVCFVESISHSLLSSACQFKNELSPPVSTKSAYLSRSSIQMDCQISTLCGKNVSQMTSCSFNVPSNTKNNHAHHDQYSCPIIWIEKKRQWSTRQNWVTMKEDWRMTWMTCQQ